MKKTKSRPKHPDIDLFSAKKTKTRLTLDDVAEALWIADNPWWSRGNPFGSFEQWLWAEADDMAKDQYYNKAKTVLKHLESVIR